MTALGNRSDPLELDLQSPESTGAVYYSFVLSNLDAVARCVFASPTPYTMLVAHHHGHVPAQTTVIATPAAPFQASSIVDAVDDLRTWLNVSYEDLAKMMGWQTASNFYHWRRRQRDNSQIRPRAATVEPILRLHALCRALIDTISGDDPTAVQLWSRKPIATGRATPLELLEQGRMDEVERYASDLLFNQSPGNVSTWHFITSEADDDLPVESSEVRYQPEDFG